MRRGDAGASGRGDCIRAAQGWTARSDLQADSVLRDPSGLDTVNDGQSSPLAKQLAMITLRFSLDEQSLVPERERNPLEVHTCILEKA